MISPGSRWVISLSWGLFGSVPSQLSPMLSGVVACAIGFLSGMLASVSVGTRPVDGHLEVERLGQLDAVATADEPPRGVDPGERLGDLRPGLVLVVEPVDPVLLDRLDDRLDDQPQVGLDT